MPFYWEIRICLKWYWIQVLLEIRFLQGTFLQVIEKWLVGKDKNIGVKKLLRHSKKKLMFAYFVIEYDSFKFIHLFWSFYLSVQFLLSVNYNNDLKITFTCNRYLQSWCQIAWLPSVPSRSSWKDKVMDGSFEFFWTIKTRVVRGRNSISFM